MKRRIARSVGILTLAIVLAVSFMPIFGQQAFASDKDGSKGAETIKVDLSKMPELDNYDASDWNVSSAFKLGSSDQKTDKGKTVTVQSNDPGSAAVSDVPDVIGSVDSAMYTGESILADIDVVMEEGSTYAEIRGTVREPGEEFYGLYVDGEEVYDDIIGYVDVDGETSFCVEVDMRDYPVGFHDIYATLQSGETVVYPYAVPTIICEAPSNQLASYYVDRKYFIYYASDAGYYDYDYDCNIYLQYKKSGSSWSRLYEIDPSTNIKMTGLKPAKKYSIRMFYGKIVEYNGQDFFFRGDQVGHMSSTKTIKMGTNKPPVKSIKPIKVKNKKFIVKYYYYGTYLYSKKYWQTSYKIKVKMKKKPKAAGVFVCVSNYDCSYRLKGNKKTYTSGKFYSTGTKKVKKKKIIVYSYQSKVYGGFSRNYSKKIKIK